jgi:hypothetical protein
MVSAARPRTPQARARSSHRAAPRAPWLLEPQPQQGTICVPADWQQRRSVHRWQSMPSATHWCELAQSASVLGTQTRS